VTNFGRQAEPSSPCGASGGPQDAGRGQAEAPEKLRVRLGRAIRALGALWRAALLLPPLLRLPAAAPLGVEGAAVAAAGADGAAAVPRCAATAAASGGADADEQLRERSVRLARWLILALQCGAHMRGAGAKSTIAPCCVAVLL
jgi:hypothetical protein